MSDVGNLTYGKANRFATETPLQVMLLQLAIHADLIRKEKLHCVVLPVDGRSGKVNGGPDVEVQLYSTVQYSTEKV